ncbi:MAG: hypothetical protein WCR96_05560 [Candidatus Methanomethylophilaceae archaeon]
MIQRSDKIAYAGGKDFWEKPKISPRVRSRTRPNSEDLSGNEYEFEKEERNHHH